MSADPNWLMRRSSALPKRRSGTLDSEANPGGAVSRFRRPSRPPSNSCCPCTSHVASIPHPGSVSGNISGRANAICGAGRFQYNFLPRPPGWMLHSHKGLNRRFGRLFPLIADKLFKQPFRSGPASRPGFRRLSGSDRVCIALPIRGKRPPRVTEAAGNGDLP